MHRYLAVIWDTLREEDAEISQLLRGAVKSRPAEWTVAYDGPGAMVVHAVLPAKATQCYRLNGAAGVVLGRLFNAVGDGAALRPVSFDDNETNRIVNSAGQRLIDRYWGSYFALVFDAAARRHYAFRDPIGTVPCYHFSHRSMQIFFSHIEDCVRFIHRPLGIALAVNRAFLTRWLLFSSLQSRQCSLQGIESIPGGERVTVSRGRTQRDPLWNPAQIAAHPREENPEAAAKALRSTVQETIDAWASCYRVITHKLSGGLDSSIVAGCLAQAPSRPRVSYLNFSADVGLDRERLHLPGVAAAMADKIRAIAAHGDERHLARLVAERWQTPLMERQRDVAMDLSRLWQAPPSINPSMYYTSMEPDDIKLELSKSSGTQAFFSGQGGDSILLATVQPLSAIDYAHVHGIVPGLWQHLLASARLSKESLWGVLSKALRHGLLRRPYRPPRSRLQVPTLLRAELTSSLTDADLSAPQVASTSGLPPGKQSHIAGVGGGSFYNYVFHSGRYADDVDPLNSQPVWELVLQLPTYTLLADGVSRGLARRAFADVLPPEIRRRTAKGVGSPFYQQVVRRNRRRLQEWMLDGSLVREGYLDRDRLEQYLAADEPFVTVSASQMLSYLAAEIWLQQWSHVALDESPSAAMASS